jgi:Mn2+/Fe2+ NRAMP family transporter
MLGPGLITGAADDPSGISTYAVAGAAYGYATPWIALLTFPLMAAIQLMCARLGIVTGRGVAAAVRIYYARWVLWGACSILVVASVINIGSDLAPSAAVRHLEMPSALGHASSGTIVVSTDAKGNRACNWCHPCHPSVSSRLRLD